VTDCKLFNLFSDKRPKDGDIILIISKNYLWKGKFFDTYNPNAPNGLMDFDRMYAFTDNTIWFDVGTSDENRIDNEIAKMTGLDYWR